MGRTSFDMTPLWLPRSLFCKHLVGGSLAFGMRNTWYVQASASSLNCPAILVLEFLSIENESPIALSWGGPSASCLKPNFLGSCLIISNLSRTSPEFLDQVTHKITLKRRVSTEPLGLRGFCFQITSPSQISATCEWKTLFLPWEICPWFPLLLFIPLLLRPHLQTFRKKRLGGVLKPRIESVISKCIRNTEVFFLMCFERCSCFHYIFMSKYHYLSASAYTRHPHPLCLFLSSSSVFRTGLNVVWVQRWIRHGSSL